MKRPDLGNYFISQGFSATHPGNDFTTTVGKPIYAPEAGRVVKVNNDPVGYFGGCYVVIEGISGYRHYLGHNSKNLVKFNDNVSEGQQVALIGKTGFADGTHPAPTGPHVHWGVSKGGVDVDGLTLITEEDEMSQAQIDEIYKQLNATNKALGQETEARIAADGAFDEQLGKTNGFVSDNTKRITKLEQGSTPDDGIYELTKVVK